VGFNAGSLVTGSHNILIGAQVTGTAADANTTRIGRPYDSGTGWGQNATYIAGIRGVTVAGGQLVHIDANGRLGSGGLGANTVGSVEVAADALTAADLATGSVGAAEVGH
jgi:hypothetical protein